MDSNQPTTTATTTTTIPPSTTVPVSSGGMFGSKVPSTVAFGVAVLLFLMPFIDIKCNNMSLQTVKGFELATGFEMKNQSSTPFLDDIKTDKVDDAITKTTTNTSKKGPNLYAMIALIMGVLGLILALVNSKTTAGGGIIAGIAGAGALIGLMLDVKKQVKLEMPSVSDKAGSNDVTETIDKIGDKMNEVTDNMKITIDFTPWFYIAVLAFLVAAFFCYRRFAAKR